MKGDEKNNKGGEREPLKAYIVGLLQELVRFLYTYELGKSRG